MLGAALNRHLGNLSHYPYREDLAYSWPDDVAKFSGKALPFDGRRLLYGHTYFAWPLTIRSGVLSQHNQHAALSAFIKTKPVDLTMNTFDRGTAVRLDDITQT